MEDEEDAGAVGRPFDGLDHERAGRVFAVGIVLRVAPFGVTQIAGLDGDCVIRCVLGLPQILQPRERIIGDHRQPRRVHSMHAFGLQIDQHDLV